MDVLDIIGMTFWFAMFATPIITIPLCWQIKDFKKIYRVLLGIISAMLLSFIFAQISVAIIFRNGIGN